MGRILIVDDEAGPRHVMARTLARAGHEVHEAGDGEEALGALAGKTFDCVITDVVMPRLDGIGLARAARERWPETPIILITGHPEIESAQSAIRVGVRDYVIKPVDTDELRGRVERVLEEERLRRENVRMLRDMEVSCRDTLAREAEIRAVLSHVAEELSDALSGAASALDLLSEAPGDTEAIEMARSIVGEATRTARRIALLSSADSMDADEIRPVPAIGVWKDALNRVSAEARSGIEAEEIENGGAAQAWRCQPEVAVEALAAMLEAAADLAEGPVRARAGANGVFITAEGLPEHATDLADSATSAARFGLLVGGRALARAGARVTRTEGAIEVAFQA